MPDADLLTAGDLLLVADGDAVPPGDEDIAQDTLPDGTVTATDAEVG